MAWLNAFLSGCGIVAIAIIVGAAIFEAPTFDNQRLLALEAHHPITAEDDMGLLSEAKEEIEVKAAAAFMRERAEAESFPESRRALLEAAWEYLRLHGLVEEKEEG